MSRTHFAVLAAAAAFMIAGCGSPGGHAEARSSPAATAAAATAAATPAPLVTAQGAAAVECSLFEPVYQQIETATKGAGQVVLTGILGRQAANWSDALIAASKAATPTAAGVDIAESSVFTGLAGLAAGSDDSTLAMSDWASAAAALKKAQEDCTGQ